MDGIDVTVYHRGARFLKNLPAHRGCAQYALPVPVLPIRHRFEQKDQLGGGTRPKDTLRHNPTSTGTIFVEVHGEGLLDAWSNEW